MAVNLSPFGATPSERPSHKFTKTGIVWFVCTTWELHITYEYVEYTVTPRYQMYIRMYNAYKSITKTWEPHRWFFSYVLVTMEWEYEKNVMEGAKTYRCPPTTFVEQTEHDRLSHLFICGEHSRWSHHNHMSRRRWCDHLHKFVQPKERKADSSAPSM